MIPIAQLRGVSLPLTVQQQETHMLVFRYFGKKPMLGLREGRTFRVLHLDRDFTAYNHG